jgi:ubiquinone/menaquinone biosynthesis C-methylase UbiE
MNLKRSLIFLPQLTNSFSTSTSSSQLHRKMSSADASSTPVDTAAKFWDKMAPGYFKSPIKDLDAYQSKLEMTQKYLKPDFDLLEFGCGTGGTSLIHAPHVKHILATDISPKMIGIAKNQAGEKQVSNVDFKVASVDELSNSIPSNSLDGVLGLSILHLVDNRLDVMKQTYKWLKPGGYFFTSTVCINDMKVAPLVKLIAPVAQWFGFFPPLSIISSDQLRQDFQDAGFSIEKEWRPAKPNGKPDKDAAIFIIGKKPE